jgi:hypothetical protein
MQKTLPKELSGTFHKAFAPPDTAAEDESRPVHSRIPTEGTQKILAKRGSP